MSKWQYASLDDWVVVYKDGREIFQHHSPDWVDVFDWLGVFVEDLGYFSLSDLPDGAFPSTIDGFREMEAEIHAKEAAIDLAEAEIVRLQNLIKELKES